MNNPLQHDTFTMPRTPEEWDNTIMAYPQKPNEASSDDPIEVDGKNWWLGINDGSSIYVVSDWLINRKRLDKKRLAEHGIQNTEIIEIFDATSGEMIPHGELYIPAKETYDDEDIAKWYYLCHWRDWEYPRKWPPIILKSDINPHDKGIVFHPTKTDDYYLDLTKGWLKGDRDVIEDYVIRHKDLVFWLIDN